MVGHEFVRVDERAQLFGKMCCPMHVGAFEYDDELFTADSIQAVRHPDSHVDDLGHALEDLVSDRMPVNVVDGLEMIEIE